MRVSINKQNNRSDSDGGLWSSFGVSLRVEDREGKLLITPRTLLNTSSDSDADLGLPVAFRYFGNNGWYAICGAKVFTNSATDRSPFDSFTEVTTSGVPTNLDANSDMETMPDNDALYISSNSTNAYKFNGTAWSTLSNAGTGGHMKKLLYHPATRRMYQSYGVGKITSWDTSDTPVTDANVGTSSGQYSLNLGVSYSNYITSLVSAPDYIWILTLNLTSNTSRQYYWDGSQYSGPNGFAVLEANGALCGWIQNNTLWIVDTLGRIMENNGKAFIERARFPFGGKTPKNSLLETMSSSTRWIMPNGVDIINGKPNLLVNNQTQDGSDESERFPAGVWEFDPVTYELYHKRPISYYAKSSGSVTDYGQHRLSAVGALIGAKHTSTDNGDMLIGCTYFSDATTTKSGIFINDSADTVEKYGSFVLGWINAAELKQNWTSINARIRKHLNSTDKIRVKYRTGEDVPVVITGTWVSTSTFNTTTDLRAYEGYEVEILNGTGGGKTAHISNVTENGASGWLITLDDTFTGVTGTFKGRVQTWKKSSTYTGQTNDIPEFPFVGLGASTRLQVKFCAQWTGKNEFFDTILNNNKHQ